MRTNGVFVFLHEKQGQGDARVSYWMLMRSEGLCLFHFVCLVKRCQSKWRGGTDVGRGVMQKGNHVESGLANRKWVTLSWVGDVSLTSLLSLPCLYGHPKPNWLGKCQSFNHTKWILLTGQLLPLIIRIFQNAVSMINAHPCCSTTLILCK